MSDGKEPGDPVDVFVDYVPVPEYSTDVAAAWPVVEEMRRQRYGVNIEAGPEGGWRVDFLGAADDLGAYDGKADTIPLAVCRAALLTLLTGTAAA